MYVLYVCIHLCVCVCICVCIYIYVYVCICVCLHVDGICIMPEYRYGDTDNYVHCKCPRNDTSYIMFVEMNVKIIELNVLFRK